MKQLGKENTAFHNKVTDLVGEAKSCFPRILTLNLKQTIENRKKGTGGQSFTSYICNLSIWKLYIQERLKQAAHKIIKIGMCCKNKLLVALATKCCVDYKAKMGNDDYHK